MLRRNICWLGRACLNFKIWIKNQRACDEQLHQTGSEFRRGKACWDSRLLH